MSNQQDPSDEQFVENIVNFLNSEKTDLDSNDYGAQWVDFDEYFPDGGPSTPGTHSFMLGTDPSPFFPLPGGPSGDGGDGDGPTPTPTPTPTGPTPTPTGPTPTPTTGDPADGDPPGDQPPGPTPTAPTPSRPSVGTPPDYR